MQRVFENLAGQTKYVELSMAMLNWVLMAMRNGICFTADRIGIMLSLSLSLFYFYRACSFALISYASEVPSSLLS